MGDISTAHLTILQSLMDNNVFGLGRLHITVPEKKTKPVLVELCWQKFELCYRSYRTSIDLLDSEIERRNEFDGRAFDPLPVQLSHGITEMAKLIYSFEGTMSRLESEIGQCRNIASFDADDAFDELARKWLRRSRHLHSRTRNYLQTMMWTQWAVESLYQAEEIAAYLTEDESRYLSGFDEESFNYLAHPPLFVALMATAAMIEEVGKLALKELANVEIEKIEGLHSVLKNLQDENLIPDEVDLCKLDENLVENPNEYNLRSARNDLAHSMTARGQTVSIEDFENYVQVVWTGISLTRYLSEELISDVLQPLGELNLIPS